MQTRKYPRTLEEAFPFDRCEYSQPMENWHGQKFSLPSMKYDVESAGHRAVFLLSIVGVLCFLVWVVV
jgi:hypothetical protein